MCNTLFMYFTVGSSSHTKVLLIVKMHLCGVSNHAPAGKTTSFSCTFFLLRVPVKTVF